MNTLVIEIEIMSQDDLLGKKTRGEYLGVFDAEDHSCLCLLNSDLVFIAKLEKTINYLSSCSVHK
jgi:hypothetical protein